ncbi:Para-aminobenzoate synthase glutamine amidotransferase component II [Phocoenobacter uteri]|uniref:Para-aminobenzoate synthase glutamine amidotransferase component II n=1 Tax=Phocoenobacter uteri TaxID=146806 RepID=A0A379C8J6_9PAST|nr:anthranilate synthase component II [Phocoenobacter uteri]MDG6882469.1 anthranilate synthase component 2 [Phocoenobacter uteri]SUB58630.1 Para-aminobenzoate synthase glutamine amidotransferase component II [Phocoenobacter uteri]
MVLIIDNHDSFTFNLVDLFRKIGSRVDVILVEDLDLAIVEKYSHILISPGPDVPRSYPKLFEMLQCYAQTKSILGVCLGHQVLCEYFGGELYNLNKVRHGQRKQIHCVKQNAIFDSLPSQFDVGLYHSWTISSDSLHSSSLDITAICDEQVVMAVAHQTLPIYGVQFHPESFMTEFGKEILLNWLRI